MTCETCIKPMLAVRDITQTPVDGWSWKDQSTGFDYKLNYGSGLNGLNALMEHVRRYRADNMLPAIDPPELRRQIEASICKRSGMESRCFDVSQKKRTIGQTISGGIAAAKAIAGGFIRGENEMSMVSIRLAEKRAAICELCPLNRPPEDQSSIEQLEDAAMLKLIGSRKTSVSEKLFSCAGCSCNLRAKVWFSRRIVNGSLDAKTRARLEAVKLNKNGAAMTCWQVREPQ